jgi:hypothetical protein
VPEPGRRRVTWSARSPFGLVEVATATTPSCTDTVWTVTVSPVSASRPRSCGVPPATASQPCAAVSAVVVWRQTTSWPEPDRSVAAGTEVVRAGSVVDTSVAVAVAVAGAAAAGTVVTAWATARAVRAATGTARKRRLWEGMAARSLFEPISNVFEHSGGDCHMAIRSGRRRDPVTPGGPARGVPR